MSRQPETNLTISVLQPCMAATPYLNCSLSPSSDSCTATTEPMPVTRAIESAAHAEDAHVRATCKLLHLLVPVPSR
jgi:hypothetical protein